MIRQYADDHTNVEITVFPTSRVPLADELRSIFQLAYWKVNPEPSQPFTPQEPYNPTYHQGIEVRGYSQVLVDAVASALRDSGYEGVQSSLDVLRVQPDNPKYPTSLNKITVTIGHP